MTHLDAKIVWLRWALTAALAYLLLLAEADVISPSALFFVAVLLATQIVLPRLLRSVDEGTVAGIYLALDTGLVLMGLLLCADPSRDLLIGYFFCIVLASFADSEEKLAGIGFVSTSVYSFYLFHTADALNHTALLIRLPFLFATTVLFGYLMQRIRAERTARLDAEARNRTLQCLLQTTRWLTSSLATREVLERVATTIRETLEVERCSIRLVGEHGGDEAEPEFVEALERGGPVIRDQGTAGNVSTILALPIEYEEEPLGVLLLAAQGRRFDSDEIRFCQSLANAAALALANARRHENLVEVDRLKTEFLANLTHELATPLQSILGYSELAMRRADDRQDEVTREFLERISDRAEEMKRHAEDLVALSRLQFGRERKEVRRVHLPTLLESSLTAARRRAVGRSLELSVDVDDAVGEVYTDGDKLRRILECLLLNAVKFTDHGSIQVAAAIVDGSAEPAAVSTRLEPWERLLRVSVRDTGIGIGEPHFAKIFEDFRQVDGSATRKFPGLGLGLAVSRRLVDVLGGTIQVRSRVGEGSTFDVLVPVRLTK